jgi:hypothetical protein
VTEQFDSERRKYEGEEEEQHSQVADLRYGFQDGVENCSNSSRDSQQLQNCIAKPKKQN